MILLDKNENLYGPSPKCSSVINSISREEVTCYDRDNEYQFNILNSLSKLFNVPQDYIYFGYGAEDILKQIFYIYYKSNAKVLLPKQSWWYYSVIIDEIKGTPVWFEMQDKGDRFSYSIDSILNLLKGHHPQIVIISSPNNPTGNSIGYDELEEILKHAPHSTVILDEAYWGYNENYKDMLPLLERFPNLIALRSFSKFFAMAGIRIGLGITSKKIEGWMTFNKRYLGYNRISERLMLASLESFDYYKEMAKKIDKDKRKYKTELEKLGFNVYHSDTNFVLVKVPEQYALRLKEGLLASGIVIKFLDQEPFKGFARITIGTETQNQIVIQTISKICNAYEKGKIKKLPTAVGS